MPLVPVAAANLPDNRVLLWSAYDRYTFGGDRGTTYTALLDPNTATAGLELVRNTRHDMFCPGTANLDDGRILVNGGSSNRKTSVFDSAAGTWASSGLMNRGRGYQANTPLDDGRVFTLGGSWSGPNGNKLGEVWNEATGSWTTLEGAQVKPAQTADRRGAYRSDNHMWLFAAGDGKVFQAGPSKTMNWYSTDGIGSTYSAGQRGEDADSMNGNAVMFDVGRILKVGGAPNYDNSTASTSAYLVDIRNGVSSRKLAPMKRKRAFLNSVVLPDGKVLVVGGHGYAVPFSDNSSAMTPELWDPATETFTDVAPMAIPRNYHSVALLLPDGRVMAGGGGLCGNCATNHPNIEIYAPPYLYGKKGKLADRPRIVQAPEAATVGSAIAVQADRAVTGFVLMRLSSVTHSVNNDQRRVPLAFDVINAGQHSYQLQLPANRGILLPGYYMLFALDVAGVPSVSTTLHVK